jgi:cytochrome c556
MPTAVRPPAAPFALVVAAVAAAGLVAPALAASRTPVQQMRHDKFEGFGKSMKAITDTLKSRKPDLAMINRRAQELAADGPQITGWFPAGSGRSAGKTEARDTIWTDPAGFATAARNFTAAAQGLVTASASGDAAATGAAVQRLGGTCKACHDAYRQKD